MQGKNWCFTINNPEEECAGWNAEHMHFMICGIEVGENGTKHIQGYVQMKKKHRLTKMKTFFPRAHLEVARGSPDQNIEYCSKDGSHHVHGEQPIKRGQRTDLEDVQRAITSGSTYDDLLRSHFGEAVKYQRSLQNIIEHYRADRKEPPTVYVYWGDTGLGKSRKAFEECPDAYWKTLGDWWDGYDGHTEVIIDEFYGWIRFDLLLRLLDRYPMRVPVKGGFRKFVAEKIIFTSNKSPKEWYPNLSEVHKRAFERRITKVVEFKELVKFTD